MGFSDIIDNWYSRAKKLLFRYKDGFFELPIMSNSPETTIKSLTRMPFVYHDAKKEVFGSDNPFLKADIHYQQLEDGLWFLHSYAAYKENVNYIRINDKHISSDYYLLFLELNTNKGKSKNALLNGMSYSNCSWVLTKPRVASHHCRFKGNETTSIVLYFNEDWVKQNFYINNTFGASSINHFFESKSGVVILPVELKLAKAVNKMSKDIFNKKSVNKGLDLAEWKAFKKEFISLFLGCYESSSIKDNLLELGYIDRKKIQEVEEILLTNLQGKFVGIDYLATQVGLSPTKLKNNFKLVFGDSIFQFFRKKQLESANLLLKERNTSVAEIAKMFGYSNPSKFSQAYKDQYHQLPSSFRKNRLD